jgi:hypothetical protein
MVQNNELTGYIGESRRKVRNGLDDLMRLHISAAVTVLPNSENAGMRTAALHDEIMQVLKVIVVSSNEHTILLNGMQQVDGVINTRLANLGRRLYIVPSLPQGFDQQPGGTIIVEIESHS